MKRKDRNEGGGRQHIFLFLSSDVSAPTPPYRACAACGAIQIPQREEQACCGEASGKVRKNFICDDGASGKWDDGG